MVQQRRLAGVDFADITRDDILRAREFLVAGTTINVAAAVTFDAHPVGGGNPGPICGELNALLERDMHDNTALLTPAL